MDARPGTIQVFEVNLKEKFGASEIIAWVDENVMMTPWKERSGGRGSTRVLTPS
jgi:hypothetical protein